MKRISVFLWSLAVLTVLILSGCSAETGRDAPMPEGNKAGGNSAAQLGKPSGLAGAPVLADGEEGANEEKGDDKNAPSRANGEKDAENGRFKGNGEDGNANSAAMANEEEGDGKEDPAMADGKEGVAGNAPPAPDGKKEAAHEVGPGAEENDWVEYNGPIEHIFFHPLIVYPELAFDGDRMSQGYYDWFVTVKEFKVILEALYKNNYILIDLNALFEVKEGEDGQTALEKKVLRLPEGKKPLVLSIDDMNYYEYMRANGNVHKLILDKDGRIATWSVNLQGDEVISRDNEIVPILDDFVETHPDFSFRGAKGLIALTGYEGVLGYRTNELHSPGYEEEKREALAVIRRLKETGWTFASHGYGHLDARKADYKKFVEDTEQWKEEVLPLTGPTSIYIYPYGSSVLPGDPKYEYLLDAGFRVLCSVGPAPYQKWLPDSMMMDRRHIDGIALTSQRSRLLPLFDSDTVIDPVRPALSAP